MTLKKLKIGVVGGSIGGCSAAILLNRQGHEVSVFERSSSRLVGRGGGIATSGVVFKSLVEQDFIDPDFPHISLSDMSFRVRTSKQKEIGYVPWKTSIDLKAFHWSTLWNNLRKRVPDDAYYPGREVVHADSSELDAVDITFRDGGREKFDLVLFADGYQSVGRKLLFPEIDLHYCGYVLWRGLLSESVIENSTALEKDCPRISYANLPGNFVIYYVPDENGLTGKGQRIFNWAAYIPIPESDLMSFMIDRHGNSLSGSIPPGRIRLEEEERLRKLMRDNLPTYFGDIVDKTKDTYVQLIYTTELPAYYRGRIALIGDAGIFVQPFTGSGVFKGYNNVKDLLQVFQHYDDLPSALEAWSQEQVRVGKRLLTWGRQLENALIWKPLNLAIANAETTSTWWKESVTFPDEFSYQSPESKTGSGSVENWKADDAGKS